MMVLITIIRGCLCPTSSHLLKRWYKTGTPIFCCYRHYACEKQICDVKIDLSQFTPERIRNFGIVAHVDHGKSTLADRLLEVTGTIQLSSHNKQVLDSLKVERDRGITVKSRTVSMIHNYEDKDYLLNLIDTPGHVDFCYETSRSLAACQGVILVVDATRGIQAQTLSNYNLANELDIEVIPVLNKIDLKTANVEAVSEEIQMFFDIRPCEIIHVSAKTGYNVLEVLKAVISRIPSPKDHFNTCCKDGLLKVLLYDSSYEKYRGVCANIAVANGTIRVGDQVTSSFLETSKCKPHYEVKEVGLLRPDFHSTGVLYCGQVGYMFCGMKSVSEAAIGDTLHHIKMKVAPFSDHKPAKPMVYSALYPKNQNEYRMLQTAIDMLSLNDRSVTIQPSNCEALGAGFTLGFLGILHMDVFKQRLEQEYGASVVSMTPTVPYKAILSSKTADKTNGVKELLFSTASDFPEDLIVEKFLQPMIQGTIIAPAKFREVISDLCMRHCGEELELTYLNTERILLQQKMPLSEVIFDFYDKLKSVTSGYGSFDYESAGYEEAEIVKLDVMLNGTLIPELSSVVNGHKAKQLGHQLCLRLKQHIPQQLFLITIQATIKGKVVASERISALRKNVTAKLYGSDQTRKMKLQRHQKEGKDRMRRVGKVHIPKDAFAKILRG